MFQNDPDWAEGSDGHSLTSKELILSEFTAPLAVVQQDSFSYMWDYPNTSSKTPVVDEASDPYPGAIVRFLICLNR